jgi:hypothetical protein
LLKRSRELWIKLNERTGKTIFHATGGLYLNPPDKDDSRREEEAAKIHNLDYQILDT